MLHRLATQDPGLSPAVEVFEAGDLHVALDGLFRLFGQTVGRARDVRKARLACRLFGLFVYLVCLIYLVEITVSGYGHWITAMGEPECSSPW